MLSMLEKIFISGFLGSILVKGIYAILGIRKDSVGSTAANIPINYQSTSEFLHSHSSRWIQYLLFRLLPFAAGEIFSISCTKAMKVDSPINNICCLLLVFSIADYWELRTLRYYCSNNKIERERRSEFIVRISIIILHVLITLLLIIFSEIFSFPWLLPSFSEVKDGIWTSLIVAIMVAAYLRITDMRRAEDESDDLFFKHREIERKRRRAKKIELKFGNILTNLSKKYKIQREIMKAILIYEDSNRPKIMRIIENALVLLLKQEFTVGIAQVTSDIPLSDKESIIKMAQKLRIDSNKNTCCDSHPQALFSMYNNDPAYVDSVISIYEKLIDETI